ncbi:2-oxoglutarate-dependent dioxygenase [Psilocybe cubensis]|uniref:Fe2OG dioxygenase domain-containing protein n=2 Tax=Psilocybe cubensis TaxID=181762 RepID=A0A8H8CPX7_PSICU|nr:2-oxoglutarate-dependent dioxygenase [Psilocybe cubensis]KAH9486019.1 2-oxoglutarate-dependent dioxygenase [Psilocybe cubensis]
MPALAYPPFPDDVPTHPLLVIDYELIKARDAGEIERLWEAGTKLGFWYLKNHGADEFVDRMFTLGAEVMALPTEEKMKFEQGDDGMSFGYKAAGANAVDATGERDTVEFLNVAKDDALAWPKQARRAYPETVNAQMHTTVVPFVKKSLEVNNTLLEVFNDRLGLPAGTLLRFHSAEEYSGSEARLIKNPPISNLNKQAIGSHTDFGTLSFLHNRLGGLQVFVPGAESWQYVKPIPNHAICNIGDALAIFSGGILRSNLHRVVPPPGQQSGLERWSLVFFTRPGNSSVLTALTQDSPTIAESVRSAPPGKYETGSTAFEWFSRRIKNQRINNRKGPETWMASRGTEQIEV